MNPERDVDGRDEPGDEERSGAADVEPGDAVPDEPAPSKPRTPPGPDPDRVIEEKGRTERSR